MATLTYDDGAGPVKVTLDPRGTTVGRLPTCDVVLTNPSISRRHAEVFRGRDGWRIRDLNSRAGVRVDGVNVGECILADGAIMQLGAVTLSLTADPHETLGSGMDSGIVSAHSISESMLARSLNSLGGQVSALGRVVRAAAALRAANSAAEVATVVLSEAALATGAQRAQIQMFDEEGEATEAHHLDDTVFTPSSTFIRRVLDEKAALIAMDVGLDDELASAMSIAFNDLRSILCVPLWTGRSIVGVLYLDRANGSFNPDHVELVLALGYLGAAELERLAAAARLELEQRRRRTVARLLPSALAAELADASGDFELEEGPMALAVAELVATGDVDATDMASLCETLLELVMDDDPGILIDADPTRITILHKGGSGMPADARLAAATALRLVAVSETLRRTRSRWMDLRLKAAVHAGEGASGVLGHAADRHVAVVGAALEKAMSELKAGRPGRIRVSPDIGPDLAGHHELIPEREGNSMAIWLIPNA